jgi:hypothetical protein
MHFVVQNLVFPPSAVPKIGWCSNCHMQTEKDSLILSTCICLEYIFCLLCYQNLSALKFRQNTLALIFPQLSTLVQAVIRSELRFTCPFGWPINYQGSFEMFGQFKCWPPWGQIREHTLVNIKLQGILLNTLANSSGEHKEKLSFEMNRYADSKSEHNISLLHHNFQILVEKRNSMYFFKFHVFLLIIFFSIIMWEYG